MNCPKCNKEFPDDKIPRFCTGCGCKLNDGAKSVKSKEEQRKSLAPRSQQVPQPRQANGSGGKAIITASACLLGAAVIIAGIYFYDKTNNGMATRTMSSDNISSDKNNAFSGGTKEVTDVEVKTEVVYVTEVVTQLVTEKQPEITTAAPVNTPASSEYILPDSSTRYIAASELTGISAYQLRVARNEIYARHGRLFNDAGLQSYFNSCSWYNGSISPSTFDANANSYFNSYEKENIKVIQSVEKSKK